MKTSVAVALALSALTLTAFPQANVNLIKERAKQVSGKSSPPPRPAGAPVAGGTAAASAPSVLADPTFQRLKADVAIIRSKTTVPPETRQQLQKDLLAAAHGDDKPAAELLEKLAADVTVALPGRTLSAEEQTQFALNLYQALNAAAETPALAASTRDLLEGAGASKDQAKAVADGLKNVAASLQKPAKKPVAK